MDVLKIIYQNFTVISDLKQFFLKFTATKPLDMKAIAEEEERCILECISAKLYMDDIFDNIAIHLKEAEKAIKSSKFLLESSMMMHKNIKLLYLDAFNEDEPLKWLNEYKKGMPLDYTFKLCKGTLSTFKGSKGKIGEFIDCSDEAVEGRPQYYDVIKFKAEPLEPWPDEDDSDKLYVYARWFELAYYTYNVLTLLTDSNLHLLQRMLFLETGMFKEKSIFHSDLLTSPFEPCKNCRRVLSMICNVNEGRTTVIREKAWKRLTRDNEEKETNTKEWNRELTILEYRKAVSTLGYGHFKSLANRWMLPSLIIIRLEKIDFKLSSVVYIRLFAAIIRCIIKWKKKGDE